MSVRVLLADDERAVRIVLGLNLKRRGWEVDEVADGASALERARTAEHDVLILDQRMPRLTGLEVVRELETDVPVVLYSAYLDADLQRQADELGCVTFPKSDIEDLVAFVAGLDPDG